MGIVKKKVRRMIEVPTQYKCDCCGTVYDAEDVLEVQEMLHINRQCGYASVFGDGTNLNVLICQTCLKNIMQTFKLI